MPPVEGELMLCWNGYHLCMAENLLGWLAPRLYEAEGRGECVRGEDKIMFRQARLLRPISTYNERILRLFACDCAERALPLHEAVLDDTRPRECIATARRYANGEATGAELDIARDAARAAASSAWVAAWDAAWAAASSASSAWVAARDAAWAAASSASSAARDARAARDAARAAAREAAWDAEDKWQRTHLLEMLELQED